MIGKMVMNKDRYNLNYIIKATQATHQRMPIGSLLNSKTTTVDIYTLTGHEHVGTTYHKQNMLIYRDIVYTLDFSIKNIK